MMFFPEYPVRAVAYQQAKIYIYENSEAFRQVHDHHTPEGRAEYVAEVARCKARFPDGFPGATPGLGKDYFITQLFLHINGSSANDPPTDAAIVGLKEYLEHITSEPIVYAPPSAVIKANLALMASSDDDGEEEEEDSDCNHDQESEASEEDQRVTKKRRHGVGYMLRTENEEQDWSGNEDENENDDEEFTPSKNSRTSRPANTTPNGNSTANSTPRISRGNAQIGVRKGLIVPTSISTSLSAPHNSQTIQPYMITDRNGLVDLSYFPRCVRCASQKRGFHCNRRFPCSRCGTKACIREPLSMKSASGHYGSRTGVMIDPSTYFP